MGRPRRDATQVGSSERLGIKPENGSGPGTRLSDVAYDRILKGLFDRQLPVGAFVSQNDLVQLLGVPVAPLRDALRVLEAEGILTIHPRSGIQFVKPGLELTRATYQFRTIIERAAVRVYAETADVRDMEALEAQHQRLAAEIEAKGFSPEHLAEIDTLEGKLHNAIVGALENRLIEASYKRMHNYLKLLRLERKMTGPIVQRTLREHIRILDACRRRDPDDAEAAVNAHFTAALQRNLGMY